MTTPTPPEPGIEAQSPDAAFRDGWLEGYLSGFNSSGEGWNGEYPFDDQNRSPESSLQWAAGRERAFKAKFGSSAPSTSPAATKPGAVLTPKPTAPGANSSEAQ
jgi:hypothetical protein